VQLLVDEVDTELELPLPTMIRPCCRLDIRFLLCYSDDPPILTWIAATIVACRARGGERLGACLQWGCEADEVERAFFRRVTGVGFDSDYFRAPTSCNMFIASVAKRIPKNEMGRRLHKHVKCRTLCVKNKGDRVM
jgi:hypothetical protein